MKFLSYINNKIPLKQNENFTLIIGESPSLGARSPILWNKVYNKTNSPIRMYPVDCDMNQLPLIFKDLEKNQNFIGGCITNPYKETLFKYLNNRIDKDSKKIGAINCLYRNKKQLFGLNTDGLGAIYSLEKKFKLLKNRSFMLFGTGGTAKTIASYIQKYISSKKDLLIVGRDKKKLEDFKKVFGCAVSDYLNISNKLQKYDYVINCTSLGAFPNENASPLEEKSFHLINPKTKIFDVIYNPKNTKFLRYAKKFKLNYLNGLEMNLEQAVKAFIKTNNINNSMENKIRTIMKS